VQSQNAGLETRVSSFITMPRRKARSRHFQQLNAKSKIRSLHLNIPAVSKREARSSRPSITAMPRRRARSPHFNCERAMRFSYNYPHHGSITAHVMSGVNPHCGGVLRDSLTPKNHINSPVRY